MAAVVIIGAGHGGFQCADSLRKGGFEGDIHLIDADPVPPYQKPPLSKEYLLDRQAPENLFFRAVAYYEKQNIRLRLGVRVERIDRDESKVHLSNQEVIHYDKLVIATGSALQHFSVSGQSLNQAHYIKTLADIEAIQAKLDAIEKVVVIGGGFIGLEFAAVSRKLGKSVTVLMRGERMMKGALTPQMSQFFHQAHTAHGVKLCYNTQIVERVETDGETHLIDQHGQTHVAELLVVGIGVKANDSLAQHAGLKTLDGIQVNERNQTSDPNIYAIGDVARFTHPLVGREGRLESVQNAVDQAKHVAADILGESSIYTAVPWFWSNQYDIKLQMAGVLDHPDCSVVRGDTASGKFSVFYYRDGKLQAVHSVSKPADHMAARKLIAAGANPSQAQVADETIKLASLLK